MTSNEEVAEQGTQLLALVLGKCLKRWCVVILLCCKLVLPKKKANLPVTPATVGH